MKTVNASLLALLLALLTGMKCERQNGEDVIARIDGTTLTVDKLKRSVPSHMESSISRAQHIEYVKNWIDKEILYQEALNRQLNKKEDITHQLKKMEKDLLCSEIIDRHIKKSEIKITEKMIRNYYATHKNSFTYGSDVYKYMEIVVDKVKPAWQLRKQLTVANFFSMAQKHSEQKVNQPQEISYRSVERMPSALAEVIPNIRVNGITSPIKTKYGYSIVKILDRKSRGDIKAYHDVRDQITQILFAQKKEAKTRELVSRLRQKFNVEINLETLSRYSSADTSVAGADSAAKTRM